MPCSSVKVATAQGDGGENGRRSRTVQVAPGSVGHAEVGLGIGEGIVEPARGQGHARSQRGRGGRPPGQVERTGVIASSPYDASRLVESAQVHEPGGQEEMRVTLPRVGLPAGCHADGFGRQVQRLGQSAPIPHDHRPGHECRDHHVPAFLLRRRQDGFRQSASSPVVAQPGQALEQSDLGVRAELIRQP